MAGWIKIYENKYYNELIYDVSLEYNGDRVEYIQRILGDDECDDEVIVDGLHLVPCLRYLEIGSIGNYNIVLNPYILSRLSALTVLELDSVNVTGGLDAIVLKHLSLRSVRLRNIHIRKSLSSFNHCSLDTLQIIRCIFEDTNVDAFLSVDVGKLTLMYNGLSMNTVPVIDNVMSLTIVGENIRSIGLDIERMTRLEKLDIEQCGLSGCIPDTISNLTRLATLSLCKNQLSGSIPTCIKQLKNLHELHLTNNRLYGPIPILPYHLNYLSLEYNNLSGSIDAIFTSDIICIASLHGNEGLYGTISDNTRRLMISTDDTNSIVLTDTQAWTTSLLTDKTNGQVYRIHQCLGRRRR